MERSRGIAMMKTPYMTKHSICVLAIALLAGLPTTATAVPIVDSVPDDHTDARNGANNFIGIITANGAPPSLMDLQISSGAVNTTHVSQIPPVSSLAGHDVNVASATADRTWTYTVAAPGGQYLTGISFTSDVTFAGGTEYEANDVFTFELFLNGSGTASETATIVGNDASLDTSTNDDTLSAGLANAGGIGTTVASVLVTLGVDGFNTDAESFFATGSLTAQSVPEPSAFFLLGLVGSLGVGYRKRNVVLALFK